MQRNVIAGLIAGSLCAACHDSTNEAQPRTPPAAAAPTTPPTAAEPMPGEHAGAQPEARTAESAAAVLRDYYAAIEAGDYATAYAKWGDHGKSSGQTLQAFQAGFAATRSSRLTVKQLGEIEGAAGSSYITIEVDVRAELKDGTRQHFGGSYALRHVNHVEGSTDEQRRWHVYSAALKPLEP